MYSHIKASRTTAHVHSTRLPRACRMCASMFTSHRNHATNIQTHVHAPTSAHSDSNEVANRVAANLHGHLPRRSDCSSLLDASHDGPGKGVARHRTHLHAQADTSAHDAATSQLITSTTPRHQGIHQVRDHESLSRELCLCADTRKS